LTEHTPETHLNDKDISLHKNSLNKFANYNYGYIMNLSSWIDMADSRHDSARTREKERERERKREDM